MKKMKMMGVMAGVMAIGVCMLTGCGEKKAASEDTGMSQEVQAIREEHPQKVVSLAPNVTEILYAVGAGDMVVGRTDYCDFPEAAMGVDSIGTYSSPNIELIVSKAPDLVIASEALNPQLEEQLKGYGIDVYVSESSNVAEIEGEIQSIGYMLGHEKEAEDLVKAMQEKETEIVELGKEIQTEKTAFIDLGSYYTAGTGSFLDAVMKDIHLKNIAGDTGEEWPQLSVELIAEGNPDVYLSFYTPAEELKQESTLASLACMKNNGLHEIDYELGSMLQRQGPRIVDAELALMQMVYGK